MPASCREPQRAPFRQASPPGRQHLRADDAAVSEVVGQILAFAIVVVIFIMSMFAFQKAMAATQEEVMQLQADSAASRVASTVVQVGLLTEEQGDQVRLRFLVDLPSDLEGIAYEVELVVPGGFDSASIKVSVPDRGVEATAPLFAIEAAAGLELCAGTVSGGQVYAVFSEDPPASPGSPCIFLEAAT